MKKIEKATEKKVPKRDTITIRLEPEWDEYITQVAAEIEKREDWPCTKTWVVTQLMKYGLSSFEKHHNIRRKSDHLGGKTA